MTLAVEKSTSTSEVPVRRRVRNLRAVPWYFIVPAMAVFVFVVAVPAVRGVVYAFTDWDGLSRTYNFIGLANFVQLFNDPQARDAVARTIALAVIMTILQTLLALGMALLLNGKVRGGGFYRALFFSPVIIMPIVTSYLWKYILGTNGALNQLLGAIGLSELQHPWLGDPTSAYWSIILIMVWQYAGIGMAIFLAGLASVPPELTEAAELDGAGPWQKFWHVTFPLLRPALTVNSVLLMITGLKVFDQVWVITGGGPGGSTDSVSTLVYQTAFTFGEFGYAISLAVVLTIVVALISGAQYSLLSRGARS